MRFALDTKLGVSLLIVSFSSSFDAYRRHLLFRRYETRRILRRPFSYHTIYAWRDESSYLFSSEASVINNRCQSFLYSTLLVVKDNFAWSIAWMASATYG